MTVSTTQRHLAHTVSIPGGISVDGNADVSLPNMIVIVVLIQHAVLPKLWLKVWYLLFGLASLATAGLGAYSSIEGIIKGFQEEGAATSFGCQSPVG